LAAQSLEICEDYCRDIKSGGFPEIRCMLCIGGLDGKVMADLVREKGVHIVVATPGRLKDLLHRRRMTLDACRYLCLDEADRMVDLGFEEEVSGCEGAFFAILLSGFFSLSCGTEESPRAQGSKRALRPPPAPFPLQNLTRPTNPPPPTNQPPTTPKPNNTQMREILSYFRGQRQTLMFSATMPAKIKSFAETALRDPVEVNVGRAGAASLDIVQEVEYVKPEDKLAQLLPALQKTAPPVLVFAENKRDVDAIHEHLLTAVS
jgi:superfamily II DNA/RNA helicase